MAVVAAPASITARSATTQSYLVLEAIATRCSDLIPKATRPAAACRARTSTCAQVTDSQAVPRGNRNASASGVLDTRSTNKWATERARCSIRDTSLCSSLAEKTMITPGCVVMRRHPDDLSAGIVRKDQGPYPARGTTRSPHGGGKHRPSTFDVVGNLQEQVLHGV